MRVLLDQGLPAFAAALMTASGYDCVHVSGVGLTHADDAPILEYARNEGRIVVTLDTDFHAMLALSGAVGPSVIRIRIEGLRASALALLLQNVLTQCGPEIEKGAAVSVLPHEIRLHKLPMGKRGNA